MAKKYEDATHELAKSGVILFENGPATVMLKHVGKKLYQRTFPDGVAPRWVSRRVAEFEQHVAEQAVAAIEKKVRAKKARAKKAA